MLLCIENGYVLVDAEDYYGLLIYDWQLSRQPYGDTALAKVYQHNGVRETIHMSRLIMGLVYGDGREVDHRNHNTLDNRKCNLRICTSSQNSMNRHNRSGSISMYKGVHWHKRNQTWVARIQVNSKRICLGSYMNERQAAIA